MRISKEGYIRRISERSMIAYIYDDMPTNFAKIKFGLTVLEF